MLTLLEKIPKSIKNSILFIFGIILLLYALGFFEKELNKIILIIASVLIAYGFIALGGLSKIISLICRSKDQPTTNYNHTNNSNDDNSRDDLF